jgi:DNA polymerase zeta
MEEDLVFPLSTYSAQSRMPIEVDVVSHQILNRHRLSARKPPPHPDAIIDGPDEPLVLSVRELWEDERNRRRARGLKPSPDLPIDPSDSSRGVGGGWSAEARWWDHLRERIQTEKSIPNPELQQDWEKYVMSTFESIEALWEPAWKVWKPRTSSDSTDSAADADRPAEVKEDVDIDVSMISSPEMSLLIDNDNNQRNADDRDEPQDGEPEGEDPFAEEQEESNDLAASPLSPNAMEIDESVAISIDGINIHCFLQFGSFW